MRVAPPDRACPEVQPRAPCRAPKAMIAPPINARIRRLRLEMCGPLLICTFRRPFKKPELNPPISAPITIGTLQSSRGVFLPASELEQVRRPVDVTRDQGIFNQGYNPVQSPRSPQSVSSDQESHEQHNPQEHSYRGKDEYRVFRDVKISSAG